MKDICFNFNTTVYGQKPYEFSNFSLDQWLDKHGSLELDEEPRDEMLHDVEYKLANKSYEDKSQ